MTKNAILMPELTTAQKVLLTKKTPERYIQNRPGPGGKMLSYVAVGYVVDQLNELFNHRWDWIIEDQQVGTAEVWVRGKLIVYLSKDFTLTKSAFGGSKRKTDIGDDLKSASSDALKKAASLIGIASDIYWPEGDDQPDPSLESQDHFQTGSQRMIKGMEQKRMEENCLHTIFTIKTSHSEANPDRKYKSCDACGAFLGWVKEDGGPDSKEALNDL